jgi:hypothetical protein
VDAAEVVELAIADIEGMVLEAGTIVYDLRKLL